MMNREEMLRRLARLLDPESFSEAIEDIDALEADGQLPHWLTQLAQAAETLPLPDVPAVVSQDLRQMFGEAALVEAYRATLIRDSRHHRPLVGVRGGTAADDWSMLYTSEAADVVIDIWPREDGNFDLEGHVMERRAADSAYRARVTGPVEVHVDGDRLGRFSVPSLLPGSYRIVVGNGEIELSFDADLGEPPT